MRYIFNCKNCGDIEVDLKVSEYPLKECPCCGNKEDLKRVYSAIQSVWKTDGAFGKSR